MGRRILIDALAARYGGTAAATVQLARHLARSPTVSTVAVLPWGVDHSVFSPAASPGDEILCVADFKAYKRHDLIVEAWLRLRAPRPALRFVGNPDVDRQTHTRLMNRISNLPEAAS